MDSRPFLEFSMGEVSERLARELKKFTKESFDLDEILSTASDLKYTKGIKKILAEEWVNPSEELVRMMAGRVYSGRLTQTVRDQFSEITKRAFHEFLSEKVNERLKSALERESPRDEPEEEPDEDAGDIVTTQDEVEACYIVKAILCEVIDTGRVFMRDRKRYCGILLDDTNRKPICRLHFNTDQKYVGTFDAEKQETKHPIQGLSEIYRFAPQMKETVLRYEGVSTAGAADPSPSA